MPTTRAGSPNFQSSHLAVGLHSSTPAFAWFATDSLGRGENLENVVLTAKLTEGTHRLRPIGVGVWSYVQRAAGGGEVETWRITLQPERITLRSTYTAGIAAPTFALWIDQKKNHATVLGLPAGPQQIDSPCVLHLPDRGSFRITGAGPLEVDARRRQPEFFVRIGFPAATSDRPAVEYCLQSALIHPALPGLESDSLYEGYRRNFLNLIQVNPRMRTLANNSSSDVCGFCFWQYAELARHAPPLAPGLTVLDLVRVSLDRVMDGGLTYGQAGYAKSPENPEAAPWAPAFDSLDTLPSFVIAASHCLLGRGDRAWADRRFEQVVQFGRAMLAQDRDGNGLIEYPLSGNAGSWDGTTRPANWWDTIGFGHEDAFSNALAYRACELLSEAARGLKHEDVAAEFAAAARRLRAAYDEAFFNPATGVLAGWRSADGRRHDYWFTFVNGLAIAFGLIDEAKANAIMDRLLAKLREVGYERFDLGLPGNLVPIRREDYTDLRRRYGGPDLADGSDAFQIYENGGATHCHAYWTIKALYRLGRVADARRLFHPMLRTFRAGGFQGFGVNGLSNDWRDWTGGCHGYEGYLCDGYLALLAVADDLRANVPNSALAHR